ncbi:ABC transporter permease [Arenibacterium sp. LLYu02]|uniref:ABC transporter permease n=1 Tax=Arenibacterium sp. LLYu02 TaxID=3404132 RepID=UPI003B21E6BE
MSRAHHARLRALLLIAPLVAFLGLFFVWPIVSVLSAAVHNESARDAFPETGRAMAGWDGVGLPDAAVQQALVTDLRSVDRRSLGGAVRKLNSTEPGFRTLMSTTTRALSDGGVANLPALTEIDPRWGEPRFWRAIKTNAARYSSRNLLAALDLHFTAEGQIRSLPAQTSANRAILVRTFTMSGIITLCCLAIGLPYALIAASFGGWRRNAMLLAVLLPLWTSLLVRTAAWYILLQDNGLVNQLLATLGLIDAPLPLIFNRLGVALAMTHVLLPFMVLPIYSVASTIPKSLMPAAASLGAPPFKAFLRVFLPLVLPGVLSGSLLVFMVATGYYITPALVGGPNDQMISGTIAFYALETANWGMAGALGLMLLAITLVLYAVYSRIARTNSPLGF